MNTRAKTAKEAHSLATTGTPWEQIVQQCGYTSTKSAKEAVRQYANHYGWKWPISKVSRRVGRPILGYASHPEAAYRLRETGLKWSEVGGKMGLFSPNANRIAQRNARKYATRNALPWPPILPKKDHPLPEGGQKSYQLRLEGISWPEIGIQTNLGKKARGRAQRYAEMAGKPWPIETNTPSPMALAYQLRIQDPHRPWDSIAKQVGYSHSNHACTGASRYWTSLVIDSLVSGKSCEIKSSSRCGFVKAGNPITLKPIACIDGIHPGDVLLVEVNGVANLKQVHSVQPPEIVLTGRSLATVMIDKVHGIVDKPGKT